MVDEKSGKGGGAGPFELGRRCEVDPRLGQLYEARNVATGSPALTLIPRDDAEWQPNGPCRMSLVYEPERNSVTVDVEQAPDSVRTSDMTNVLTLATTAFQQVEDDTGVERHIASGHVRRSELGSARAHRVWPTRTRLAVAGATMLAAGLGGWFFLARVSVPPVYVEDGMAPQTTAPRQLNYINRNPSEPVTIAYPMPDKPVPKQAVAPCKLDYGEVEINKGCWVELGKKPPCALGQAEYQSKCYLPVHKEDPVPQSVKP